MLTILLILLLLGVFSGFPLGNSGYDYRYGGGGVGLVILIIVVLLLTHRL